MQNYTPVPTQFTGDVPLPQDVIDDVVVGTVNPAFQQVSDGVAFNTRASMTHGYFVGGVTATGTEYPILPYFSSPASGAWLYAGGEDITVPYTGVYVIQITMLIKADSTSNPSGGGVTIKNGVTTLGIITGFRFSADDTELFTATGTATVSLVAGNVLRFWNESGYDIDVWNVGEEFANPIIITYLGKAG